MAFLVFDACALIALADREKGADLLASFLVNDANTCFIHSINLCEVYYRAYRNRSKHEAMELVEGFLKLGVILRDDMDVDFWQEAGALKAIHKRVSLADCFALTLAKRLDAELLTSDHHELDALATLGVCKILFFRLSHTVPIPNTAVKPAGTDDTAAFSQRESRKSPESISRKSPLKLSGLFLRSESTRQRVCC